MAEYVDKQKARDLFQQKCYNVSDRINSVEVGMFVEGIMQVLDEATVADVQLVDRWISVDETLPEMAEISSNSVECIVSMLEDFYKENKQLKQLLDYQKEEAKGYYERSKQFKEDLDKANRENKELRDKVQKLQEAQKS